MAAKLRKANPEAFQNMLKRMLEAKGRGFWDPDDEVRKGWSFMRDLRGSPWGTFGGGGRVLCVCWWNLVRLILL